MIRRLLSRFRKEEDGGTASVEFVIVFPLIIAVFMCTFEMAMIATRSTMLERGLDMVMRDVRLGDPGKLSPPLVKQMICQEARIIPDCNNVISLDVREIVTQTWDMPHPRVPCNDRANDTEAATTFQQAASNRLMLVRTCIVVDPWFPLTGLGLALAKDPSGGFQMYATTAFVAEPL